MSNNIGSISPKSRLLLQRILEAFLWLSLLLVILAGLWLLAHPPAAPPPADHPRLSWSGHGGAANCPFCGQTILGGLLAFSPDGKTLASGGENVILWNPLTGQELVAIPHVGKQVVFAPAGQDLAIANWDYIGLWDIGKQEARLTVKPPGFSVGVAFSPGGEILASAFYPIRQSKSLMLWNVADGKERAHQSSPFNVHPHSIAFSPEGNIVATGWSDGLVRLWDIKTGSQQKFRQHDCEIPFVAFLPDGKALISASRDGVVRVSGMPPGKSHAMRKAKWRIWCAALAPDGRSLALSLQHNNTVELWDVPTGKTLAIFQDLPKIVDALAFSPDSRTLATGCVDGTISLWDVPQ